MIGAVPTPERAEGGESIGHHYSSSAGKETNVDSNATGALREFREAFYRCMQRRGDALFDLADAILTAGRFSSSPHLSLAPVHRRGWASLYAALREGEVDKEDMRELLARYPLACPRSSYLATMFSDHQETGRAEVCEAWLEQRWETSFRRSSQART